MQAYVYLDESGNSGPRYVDPDQPFYVLGGWIAPYDDLADVAATIERHRQDFAPQVTDLKAGNFLKTDRKKQGAISLFRALGSLGCIPIFEILEKRFCIAAKIVETYLDPAYNPAVTNAFIPDTTSKIEIANTLYERLPEAVLNEFADVYRAPTEESFARSLTNIVSATREHVRVELADLFEGARAGIGELYEGESDESFSGNGRAALNLPAFVGVLMLIERLGRDGFADFTRLVHDETAAYEDLYANLHEVHRNAGEGVYQLPNGGEVLYPLQQIPEFDTVSSDTSPFIQAADVLAGTVARYAKLALLGRNFSDVDRELASFVFPALTIDRPRIAWSVGSSRWYRAMTRTCMGLGAISNTEEEPRQNLKGPLPLFPVDRTAVDDSPRRVAFPAPAWGLVGRETGHLMCVAETEDDGTPVGSAVLLFDSEAAARRELEDWSELTEPMDVEKFDGPRRLAELVDKLAKAASVTDTLLVLGDQAMPMQLAAVVEDLRNVLDRCRRAARSGAMSHLFQRHERDGVEIGSVLGSTGEYVAQRVDGSGELYKGSTREKAVSRAFAGELPSGAAWNATDSVSNG